MTVPKYSTGSPAEALRTSSPSVSSSAPANPPADSAHILRTALGHPAFSSRARDSTSSRVFEGEVQWTCRNSTHGVLYRSRWVPGRSRLNVVSGLPEWRIDSRKMKTGWPRGGNRRSTSLQTHPGTIWNKKKSGLLCKLASSISRIHLIGSPRNQESRIYPMLR